ncbi:MULTISPECIES: organic hydroperoxide resistance protein [Kocuria]|uniref:Organic hydroperoxide resistance protein n=1 Tax=Kocuria gwangalliensis TaxID=501592 RepID=A0ABP8X2Z2_9MICC|nr:organic hydroperoxide resistance protein [Kocuria sp.]MDO5367547.1 organic hydroperoxide resistance protein [Kocuria sp.]
MEPMYTAEALSTGDGRSGHVRTSDDTISVDLAPPKEMGGSGNGNNPEQLFAAGYAACFHSALQLVAKSAKKDLGDSAVGAQVSIGKEGEGFGLSVVLEAVIPNLPEDEARELVEQAHQVCPYSRATRGNIEVELRVTNE